MIQKYFSLFFIAAVILSLVLVNRSHAATNGSPASFNEAKTKQVQMKKNTVPAKKPASAKKSKKKVRPKVIIKKAPVKKPITNGTVNGKNGKQIVKPKSKTAPKPSTPKGCVVFEPTPGYKTCLSPTPLVDDKEKTSIPQDEISNSAQ